MSSKERPEVGSIGWTDLTVADAERIRDFYSAVAGWTPEPVDMGGYNDFNMNAPASGRTIAGICHARGVNADLPPQWMVYITVEDVERSARACVEHGGTILLPARREGGGSLCVIRDPAGAVAALYAPARPA